MGRVQPAFRRMGVVKGDECAGAKDAGAGGAGKVP